MTATRIKDFTQGNIPKQLAVFAWPLFLSNLLQVVYNMVDMMVVGQFAQSADVSAVSTGSWLMWLGLSPTTRSTDSSSAPVTARER